MNSKAIGCVVAVCTTLALAAQPVMAQETEGEDAVEWAEEGRHELGLFLGVTDKKGDTGFSVGLDYEYRLSEMFGIGGFLEYTGSDFRDGIVGVPFYVHPWKELKLVAAPGVEIEAEDGSESFLVRVGAEYGFGIGRGFEIAPALYLDFTSEDVAIVAGAAIARSF
jgi:hypothetical protein